AVRAHGGEGLGFTTIVGAGTNGARPHHTVTDRPIRAGEPVVIDMGARYEGYSGDLTRTVIVGEPDEQFRRVYDTVLRAMRHAEEVARPGMTGGELDAAARGVIAEAGYGDAFLHGLGHGIGLQVHEAPSARKEGEDVFAAGMSLTIEPGIYLPDWGGVRIEDLVVFTPTGIANLTDAPVLEV
ncbi:MAG: M24 family metallopeptidase, partial [Thermomicrobia bacterium]|nr:M24 family metallopeptidase [Thermomicrobia bacterium]